MSRAGFGSTARVASGSVATEAFAPYDVRVGDGRLRLSAHASAGVVLEVALDRVTARPLGRAGTSVVEVDGAPLLVDLTRRAPGPVSPARRVAPALRGRWLRRRFLVALSRERS